MPYFWVITVLSILPNAHLSVGERNLKLVNGTIAKLGQFPYTVLILYWNYDTRCTGALIGTRHIITAAHCPYIENGPIIKFVMAGDVNKPYINKHNELQQVREFRTYVVHPKYPNTEGWLRLQYDIGIILIDMPFVLTDNLHPIDVAKSDPEVGSKCVLPGWGFTHFMNICDTNMVLRYKYDLIFSRNTCKLKDYTVICGGISYGCPGDCGGAIICDDSIRGIFTYAVEVERKLRNVYTSTAPHWKWIQSIVNEQHYHYRSVRLNEFRSYEKIENRFKNRVGWSFLSSTESVPEPTGGRNHHVCHHNAKVMHDCTVSVLLSGNASVEPPCVSLRLVQEVHTRNVRSVFDLKHLDKDWLWSVSYHEKCC